MTEDFNDNNPVNPPTEPPVEAPVEAQDSQPSAPPPPPQPAAPPETHPEEPARMEERLERLGGEPAPAITPEEFARLQRAGQVHIDARGRVRTARRTDAEAGVSLRKRRAWYG